MSFMLLSPVSFELYPIDIAGAADDGTIDVGECARIELGESIGMDVSGGMTNWSGDDVSGGCSEEGGRDVGHRWSPPYSSYWTFDTEGSAINTVLRIFDAYCETELECDNDSGSGSTSRIDRWMSSSTDYIIIVDGYRSSEYGMYQLNITETE